MNKKKSAGRNAQEIVGGILQGTPAETLQETQGRNIFETLGRIP